MPARDFFAACFNELSSPPTQWVDPRPTMRSVRLGIVGAPNGHELLGSGGKFLARAAATGRWRRQSMNEPGARTHNFWPRMRHPCGPSFVSRGGSFAARRRLVRPPAGVVVTVRGRLLGSDPEHHHNRFASTCLHNSMHQWMVGGGNERGSCTRRRSPMHPVSPQGEGASVW
jgi:hypothetical protein